MAMRAQKIQGLSFSGFRTAVSHDGWPCRLKKPGPFIFQDFEPPEARTSGRAGSKNPGPLNFRISNRRRQGRVAVQAQQTRTFKNVIFNNSNRGCDPGSWIQDPGSQILDHGSRIQDPGSWIWDPRSRILDPSSWILILDPGS